ncbi:MAG TPA: alpha/beta hydrolase-fold protein [Gaiellaceae bacterium]|nr:alpha/beta hydrolase-fold protein [Gaiellaceae bacterium]
MSVHRTDRWQTASFTSEALRGNPLGDPHVRPLHVYVPEDTSRRYPSVYVLQGMMGMADGWFNVEPWSLSYPDRISALAPDAVVVLVDAFTAVGGSQYVDSPGIGNYHTYLCDELVPYVDANFPTLPEARHRGIQGKSSGGYGAMITPLLRPDLFGGLATHAGDALFEVSYARDFAPAARALRDRYGSSFDAFWEDFRSGRPVLASPDDALLVDIYAMSAAYSARADGTVDLPFDIETGERIPEVWERWLTFDPVLLAREPEHAETIRGLQAIWIDCGRHDEYFLDLGATAFHREVVAAGTSAERVRFELFPGTHRGLTWRYPLSLAWLVERLSV